MILLKLPPRPQRVSHRHADPSLFWVIKPACVIITRIENILRHEAPLLPGDASHGEAARPKSGFKVLFSGTRCPQSLKVEKLLN